MMRTYLVRFGGGLSQKYRLCRRQLGGSLPYPGADYEAILSELAKYGASLILATQSLARLEALDRDQGRSLRATVFANLDGLFAFHTSAEDAEYLVRELGGDVVDESDLIELGEHQCYAKLSAGGERLPTFSVSLDPPPVGDADMRDALADASAARFGRDATAVDEDLRSALTRIEACRAASLKGSLAGGGNVGDPSRAPDEPDASAERQNSRKEHHKSKRNRGGPPWAASSDRGHDSSPADAPDLVQAETHGLANR